MQTETIILKSLLTNEEYLQKVLPYLKIEYFTNEKDRVIFKSIHEFVEKYRVPPTLDALSVVLESLPLNDSTNKEVLAEVLEFRKPDSKPPEMNWLVSTTEEFCKNKAIYNAIMESIQIIDGKTKKSVGAIQDILSDALSVNFDPRVGHDYFEDAHLRWDYYHKQEYKIPFDLDLMNRITKKGISRKTLNIICGTVHSGKTLFKCHFAASYLLQGKNVLYITLEMAEEEITRRIETNLLNLTFEDLDALPREMFNKKVSNLRNKTAGKLIVKEYPSTSASVIHFQSLLHELQLKKNFIPDVLIIDYLNICASSRIAKSGAGDMYQYVKSISEEIRGFAQSNNIPVLTSCQLNRLGSSSSDPEMTDVAESFGLTATSDLLLVIISNDKLRALNHIMVKQLKNRYDDMEKMKRFVLGIDRSKMRLYDLEDSAQETITKEPDIQKHNKFLGIKVN